MLLYLIFNMNLQIINTNRFAGFLQLNINFMNLKIISEFK